MTVSVPNPLLVGRIQPGFLSNGDRTLSRGVPLSLVKSLFCLVGQKIRQDLKNWIWAPLMYNKSWPACWSPLTPLSGGCWLVRRAPLVLPGLWADWFVGINTNGCWQSCTPQHVSQPSENHQPPVFVRDRELTFTGLDKILLPDRSTRRFLRANSVS